MGDFNYSYNRSYVLNNLDGEWLSFLDEHSYNCFSSNDYQNISIFRRSDTSHSTIDYTFISKLSFAHNITSIATDEINNAWTNHDSLNVNIRIKHLSSPTVPGLWKANPLFLKD
ncbi:unnamed protein product [Cunninghamella echinulata]